MGNKGWRLPGRHIDWTQEAQVDTEWIGGPTRNFKDGSRWDPSKGSPREYVWVDDANCAGTDPEAFQVAERGDPEAGDLIGRRLLEYNRDKLEYAAQVCVNCPVRQTCLDESTAVDRYWSVRGGELPLRVAGEEKRRNQVPTWDNKEYEPAWHCPDHGTLYKRSYRRKDKKGREYTQVYCQECWKG